MVAKTPVIDVSQWSLSDVKEKLALMVSLVLVKGMLPQCSGSSLQTTRWRGRSEGDWHLLGIDEEARGAETRAHIIHTWTD
jgi:hypothetical protein